MCWVKGFLGICALTPSHANQHALPDPAAARSVYLSVKKRGGEVCRAESSTHEGVSEAQGFFPV